MTSTPSSESLTASRPNVTVAYLVIDISEYIAEQCAAGEVGAGWT